MKEIMIALMVWISTQTGYTVNVEPPNLHFMTPEQVADVCIDEGTLIPYVAQSCYKLHKHSIYMRNSFRLDDPDAVGVLVHELTHVLQLSNGHIYDLSTMDYLEAEAERIEAVYENNKTIQAKIEAIPYGSSGTAVAAARPSEYTSSESSVRSSTPTAAVHGTQYNTEPLQVRTGQSSSNQVVQDDQTVWGYSPAARSQQAPGPPVAAPQTQTEAVVTHQSRHYQELKVAQQTSLEPESQEIQTGPTSNYYVPVTEYQAVASKQAALQKELKSALTELDSLKREVQALHQEKDGLAARAEDLKTTREQLNSLNLEVQALRKEKQDLLSRMEEYKSDRRRLDSLGAEVQALRQENESMVARVEEYKKQFQNAQPEDKAREIAEKTAKEKMADLEKELIELKEENKSLHETLVDYKKKLVKQQPNTTITPPIAHKDDTQDKTATDNRIEGVPQYRIYVVKPGDSIWLIAKNNSVKRATVIELNNLEGTLIKPGQKLLLPARDDSEEIHATFRKGSFISPRLVR